MKHSDSWMDEVASRAAVPKAQWLQLANVVTLEPKGVKQKH